MVPVLVTIFLLLTIRTDKPDTVKPDQMPQSITPEKVLFFFNHKFDIFTQNVCCGYSLEAP